jgi:hypothetical protein
MAADVNIAGPARQLLRVREQGATLRRVEGAFRDAGPAAAVRVVFEVVENGRRLAITLDRAAWEELRDRVERAFIGADLPGQMLLL